MSTNSQSLQKVGNNISIAGAQILSRPDFQDWHTVMRIFAGVLLLRNSRSVTFCFYILANIPVAQYVLYMENISDGLETPSASGYDDDRRMAVLIQTETMHGQFKFKNTSRWPQRGTPHEYGSVTEGPSADGDSRTKGRNYQYMI